MDPSLPFHPTTSGDEAALEVLRLLGYVLDMWSRHKHRLQAMVSEGRMVGAHEASIVERLRGELNALHELWPSSSASDSEDEEVRTCMYVVRRYRDGWPWHELNAQGVV